MKTVRESTLPNLIHRGKVRDLMVATDRISVFDVVLPTSIPGKGAVLNQISGFWFEKTSNIVQNHLISLADDNNDVGPIPEEISRRSMVVRKAERIDVECVIRGYITGSAWSEYRKSGTVNGQTMPQGMKEGDPFPEPLFTPTTKAEVGHDEPMTIEEVENMVGKDTATLLAEITRSVYESARDFALTKGIIIADTKLEFGMIDGQLTLIDELLTPDSSRFWDKSGYSPGKSLPNFDKQFVRDWVNEQGWDHEPPAPELPESVVNKTIIRYEEAIEKLTGNQVT